MIEIDEHALEAGRRLFAGPCTFLRSVTRLADLPPAQAPEAAFAGRSNVGKSSLLNALTNRRMLARVSNTPGRTQALNYFDLGGVLVLVDMPGYGYAKAPKDLVAAWQGLVDAYLRGRSELQRLVLLIDSRHGLKPVDGEWMDRFDRAAVGYQIVLTKADKVSGAERRKVRADVVAGIAKRAAASPDILFTSVKTGEGIPELRARLAMLASPGVGG